jgi:hypothetical protein
MKINTPSTTDREATLSAKARSGWFTATGGILVCCVMFMLIGPRAALATPPKDFASVFTRSFFEKIRVLSGTRTDGDDDAKVKIIAKEPSDVYVVTNTVASGGYSGWLHTQVQAWCSSRRERQRSMTATIQPVRLSGTRQEPDSSTQAVGTCIWCAMKARSS